MSDPGHLANGSNSLPEPLRVEFSKSSWTAPVSNDPVTVVFKQLIKATDPLRTGSYSRTLTFTLSTATPELMGAWCRVCRARVNCEQTVYAVVKETWQ